MTVSTRSYERGLIKVVWIDNNEFIYSKMFDDEKPAEKFAKDKKDYLIFKLVRQNDMEDFTWKLLKYGRYDVYKFLFNQYKKGLLSGWLKGK